MASEQGEVFLRPLQPEDGPALKLLHQQLFPLDYDESFYTSATQGLDGISAWAACAPLPALTHVGSGDVAPQLVPPPSAAAHAELLAGFITARGFTALYADPLDRRLLGVEGSTHDGARLLYVLTLGVAPAYQRRGIAHRLLERALQHAARAACRAVYLHVAAFNGAALAFYARAGFRQLASLPGFYTIRTGRQPVPSCTSYDACLLALSIAPPSPWDAASLALQPLTAAIGSLNACLPWGPPRRKVSARSGPLEAGQAVAAAAAADCEAPASPAHPQQQQQRQQQQQLDSSSAPYSHPPGGPLTQQPSPLLEGRAQQQDWLHQLFARR